MKGIKLAGAPLYLDMQVSRLCRSVCRPPPAVCAARDVDGLLPNPLCLRTCAPKDPERHELTKQIQAPI